MKGIERKLYFSVFLILILTWIGIFRWAYERFKTTPFLSSPSVVSHVGINQYPVVIKIPRVTIYAYMSRPGDTFQSIAHQFGVSVQAIRSLNHANASRDHLKPSKMVLVPSKNGIYYWVQPGVNLSAVAHAYQVSIKTLLLDNHIRSNASFQSRSIIYIPPGHYLSKKNPRWIVLKHLAHETGFIKPVSGWISDEFGERIDPITQLPEFHEGLDIAADEGTPVVAAQKGIVIFAAFDHWGYGNLVIIDHGHGLISKYAHLSKILVKKYQLVQRGQVIGLVGETGDATGPHLHFEIRLNGIPQDPLIYLAH
jgi:murein DD-endopeptidase MepM/ murein hydrolase activator NlpD